GGTFTLCYVFSYLGWFFIPGTAFFPNTAEHWVLGISPLSIGCVGAAINFIAAIAVSNMTEVPSEEIQEMVRRVRYP
ncbi:MAG: hypothetical protein RBQ99_03525, partial [Trichlorobacter sp.]|nr:hypothetical protein [Trichlorobacter sp.]